MVWGELWKSWTGWWWWWVTGWIWLNEQELRKGAADRLYSRLWMLRRGSWVWWRISTCRRSSPGCSRHDTSVCSQSPPRHHLPLCLPTSCSLCRAPSDLLRTLRAKKIGSESCGGSREIVVWPEAPAAASASTWSPFQGQQVEDTGPWFLFRFGCSKVLASLKKSDPGAWTDYPSLLRYLLRFCFSGGLGRHMSHLPNEYIWNKGITDASCTADIFIHFRPISTTFNHVCNLRPPASIFVHPHPSTDIGLCFTQISV